MGLLWTPVADALRERCRGARDGAQLPSIAELRAEYGITVTTARRALQALREEGLVVTYPGRGSFVRGEQTAGTLEQRVSRLEADVAEILRKRDNRRHRP